MSFILFFFALFIKGTLYTLYVLLYIQIRNNKQTIHSSVCVYYGGSHIYTNIQWMQV